MSDHGQLVRIVLYILGSVLLLVVVGIIALTIAGEDLPEVLGTIAVGALGALTGIIVKTEWSAKQQTQQDPQDEKLF